MKVMIYTAVDYGRGNDRRAKLVWRGDLALIPRIGDFVIVADGFASETVEHVHWDLIEQEVEITLRTKDSGDEYPDLEMRAAP